MLARKSLTFLLLFPSVVAVSQQISQLSVMQQGNEVIVSYHLDGQKGKAFHVSLYASHDNFSAPLRMVQGDVGNARVLAGAHTIRWKSLDELKNFDGDISFEIRASPAPPMFTSIVSSSPKVKRGDEVTISWKGTSSDAINIELVKDGVATPIGTSRAGTAHCTLPQKMKTGKYSVVLTSGGETVPGIDLSVKPRISVAIKVISLAVVGGILIWSPWNNNRPTKDGKLIEPPDLTGD